MREEDQQLWAPAMTADGWFERLTGYVAEQKAASALEAAGHHVTFAATANQPVWDLLVDGHPVQIKEGLLESTPSWASIMAYPYIRVMRSQQL